MKINKKTIIITVLAAALICALSFTATFAYLIDRDAAINQFYFCDNTIEIDEEFDPPAKLEPNVFFKKKPWVKNNGNLPVFVRVKVEFSNSAAEDFCYPLEIMGDWDLIDGYYYYKKILEPDKRTDTPVFEKVHIRPDVSPASLVEFDIIIYAESVQVGEFTEADYANPSAWRLLIK